jgi:hypothetical protein
MTDIVERLNRGEGCLEEGGKTCISMDAESGCLCAIAAAEITRLRERLEIDPRHPYDGIHCRDETIRGQDAEITRLRAEVARKDAALKWYASAEAWTVAQVEGPDGDYGDRARAALTQEKKAAELGITLENPATALTAQEPRT